MDSARIAALLAPFLSSAVPHICAANVGPYVPPAPRPASDALSPHQLQQLSVYLDLLLRWNARMNLTAVRDPEYIVSRHFGESLFAAAHLFPVSQSPAANCQLLDIGSGAGFPGLPVKIWAPQLALTLIESRQRKATFLREVVRALSLTSAEVFCGRAEDFAGHADVVALRAVERFDDILPVASRLVAGASIATGISVDVSVGALSFAERSEAKGGNCSGRLALLIGASQVERARELVPSFTWAEPVPIPLSAARVLLIGTRNT